FFGAPYKRVYRGPGLARLWSVDLGAKERTPRSAKEVTTKCLDCGTQEVGCCTHKIADVLQVAANARAYRGPGCSGRVDVDEAHLYGVLNLGSPGKQRVAVS